MTIYRRTSPCKQQTSTLTGPALGWAVGQVARLDMFILPAEYGTGPRLFATIGGRAVRWTPESSPDQAWPLLVTHGRRIRLRLDFQCNGASYLEAGIRTDHTAAEMLTAALRSIVASKMGPSVIVPGELSPVGPAGGAA